MIKAPNNWDKVHASEERRKILPGGYVIKILEAEDVIAQSGYNYLDLTIDVCEGDYKDFYKEDHASQQDPKRWRGHVRQGIPAENAAEDDWTARAFKGMINAIEHSNSGYKWNWDEKTLKGKTVGCLFRSEEYDFNGYHGFATKPWKLVSADRIREGKFDVPAPKELKAKPAPSTPQGFEAIKDEDIPF